MERNSDSVSENTMLMYRVSIGESTILKEAKEVRCRAIDCGLRACVFEEHDPGWEYPIFRVSVGGSPKLDKAKELQKTASSLGFTATIVPIEVPEWD